MAEAFLSVLLQNLYSLIEHELGSILGVDKEMKKLASTLTTIQAVLEDAEQKQLESEPIRNWLIKLSHLTHEIDDVLDECATHVSKSNHMNRKSRTFGLKKILARRNLGKSIKDVTEKLSAVAAEREFHLNKMDFEGPSKIIVAAARETGSMLNDVDHTYGREDEKEEIVDILVNLVKEYQDISILPIVGLGGLGKTTLAQLVYKDNRVVEHFEIKLWVCVSDNFDLKTLIKAMIESATGSSGASDLLHLDALERRLWDLLNRRRYLLVLDDVWNDDQEMWFKLRNVLACGSAGSAILTTTRQRKVAEVMGTRQAHYLKGLSEEHCWLLLKHRAFLQEEEDQFPELEAIGKQIVKKCAGVPLAAKALGGLLRFKRTVKEWVYVKESEIWDLPQETLILPALRLSYHHLPLALRQCFAYCAVFPKDTRIKKEKLILLWMAHGYITSNKTLEAEDVGEQIWNELIVRSLFQNVTVNAGKLLKDTVIMHDLVHDLAYSIMENKVPGAQLERISTSASNTKIREVVFPEHYVAFPKSILLDMDISSLLKSYSRLRVLDASTSQDFRWVHSFSWEQSGKRKETILELPSTIGKLNHLRLLNLSGSEIRILPSSLCSLWNLQVLNLKHCSKLVSFPKNMRYLNNLRHLFLIFCDALTDTPLRVGELHHLKTLEKFIVGTKSGNQLQELECLNLGGHLEILHLERVEDPTDAKKASLAKKQNLTQLCLSWEIDVTLTSREDKDAEMLEALQPHPNIECLAIRGFSGRHFPNWMTTMTKLVQVEVIGCKNLMDLCTLQELPHLGSLQLLDLSVEYIVRRGNASSEKFPSVKILGLCDLPNLKRFFKWGAGEMFPNLQELGVVHCPSLVLPQLSKLKRLQIWGSSLCLNSIPKLANLEKLFCSFDENTMCIPQEALECLTNLKTLCIQHAHEQCLPIEGLRRLNSLQTLEVTDTSLRCLPGEWLCCTTLEELKIKRCVEFMELPEEIRCLDTLREMSLVGLPKMVCIPEAIRYLSSLYRLYLDDLPELTSLPDWFGNLTALCSLDIRDCPKLASLPSCIKAMPNLRYLSVEKCPNLVRRCEEGRGDDWHKISHIPNLDIRS